MYTEIIVMMKINMNILLHWFYVCGHVRSAIESPWVELETLSLDEGENPSAIRQFWDNTPKQCNRTM